MSDDLLFACNCDDENEEKIQALWNWFDTREVGRGWKPVDIEERATRLLHALRWGFEASVIDIRMDMWGAFVLEVPDRFKDKGKYNYWVQFDRFEDGLVLVYKHLVDTFGDGPAT